MKQDISLIGTINNIYGSITNLHDLHNYYDTKSFPNITHDIQAISNEYELIMGDEAKKKTGSFYTDRSIVRYMLLDILDDVDIAANPFLKILDPSCGCGYFLLEAYDILKEKFQRSIKEINLRNIGLNLEFENIHNHIIQNNLFGADLDPYGVKLTTIGLMLKSDESIQIPNIICCNSVINWEVTIYEESSFWGTGYDIIIGNPPYIGHKKMPAGDRKILNNIYGDVFKDKADISFCFIKSSIDRLRENGRLCFITSRYFMESPSGKALRAFIKLNCLIEKIVDFYGVRIMRGIAVDPVIVYFRKSNWGSESKIKVLKAEKLLKKLEGSNIFDELKRENNKYFMSFTFNQQDLRDDGWTLLGSIERDIIKKIEGSLATKLSDVCTSFQGVITGCDKAFIIDDDTVKKYNIEKDILKPWIKGKCIKKFKILKESNLYIIYSDLIKDVENYKNSISYIANHRERLSKRRECIKGTRKWFELQWGRDYRLFERKKIVFPYKSSSNRFAIDEGSFSSADVYGMYVKEIYKDKISYEFLLGLLNSSLYEFYFKSFGKKLGDDLYDYYPNTVMRLMISCEEDKFITESVKAILNTYDESSFELNMSGINKHIYDLFNISDEEIKLIEGRNRRL